MTSSDKNTPDNARTPENYSNADGDSSTEMDFLDNILGDTSQRNDERPATETDAEKDNDNNDEQQSDTAVSLVEENDAQSHAGNPEDSKADAGDDRRDEAEADTEADTEADAEADAEDEDSDDSKGSSDTAADARRGFPRWVALVMVAVAAVACGLGAWQGYGYFQERQQQQRAQLRDDLIDLASSVFISTMTLSPDSLDSQLAYAEDNATDTFRSQIEQYKEEIRQALTEEGSHTDAQVTNAAVSELDEEGNTATVLMIISANWYRNDELTAASRQAMRVLLERVEENGEQNWKVADMPAVGPMVPIGPSSESVQGLDGATAPGNDTDPGGQAATGAGEQSTEAGR